MRCLLIALSLVLLNSGMAVAHCGKPHPDSKSKPETSRPLPKPE
jgi:hypothetical protein